MLMRIFLGAPQSEKLGVQDKASGPQHAVISTRATMNEISKLFIALLN